MGAKALGKRRVKPEYRVGVGSIGDARGLSWGRPPVYCRLCDMTFRAPNRGGNGKRQRLCSHLRANFDVDFSPCDCPPMHLFQGVDCRVVLQVSDTGCAAASHVYECIDCGVRWEHANGFPPSESIVRLIVEGRA